VTIFEHFLQNSVLPPDVCGGKMKIIGLPHLGHVTEIDVFILFFVFKFFLTISQAQNLSFSLNLS
jgi:hypothetical protein